MRYQLFYFRNSKNVDRRIRRTLQAEKERQTHRHTNRTRFSQADTDTYTYPIHHDVIVLPTYTAYSTIYTWKYSPTPYIPALRVFQSTKRSISAVAYVLFSLSSIHGIYVEKRTNFDAFIATSSQSCSWILIETIKHVRSLFTISLKNLR